MAIRLRAEAWMAARRAGWMTLVAASALMASGQSASVASSYQFRISAAARQTQVAIQPYGEILREIDDPSTGNRWLLIAGTPGGPGRLILSGHRSGVQSGAGKTEMQPASAANRPVIHAGDALIVEEHTAVVNARLEAVALNPALKGAPFKARLKIGGTILRVWATAPGRAVIAAAGEGGR